MTEKRKLLYWEGSSKKDFKEFPIPVQKDMGVALFVVQLGQTPDSAKPWKGLGSGVYELVEDHRGDTFRAVYTVRIGDGDFTVAAVTGDAWFSHTPVAWMNLADWQAYSTATGSPNAEATVLLVTGASNDLVSTLHNAF